MRARGLRSNISDPNTRWPTIACLLGAIGALTATAFIILSSACDEIAGTAGVFALLLLIASGSVVTFGAVLLGKRGDR
ncbi:hypothetical protein ABMA10_18690 [Plantibacter sp. RU18]